MHKSNFDMHARAMLLDASLETSIFEEGAV
jgi:hypothetical protein